MSELDEFFDDPSTGLMTVIFPDLPEQIEGDVDHEKIKNLLGGDENGHYHLTAEVYDKVTAILDMLYSDEDTDPSIIDCGEVGNT